MVWYYEDVYEMEDRFVWVGLGWFGWGLYWMVLIGAGIGIGTGLGRIELN